MGDKLITGLVTAVVIAPICSLCILGPAVFASIFVGIVGWLGGLGPALTIGLVLVAGITVYAKVRQRKTRRPPMALRENLSDER